MQLTPPKKIVFYISLLLAVLALVGYFVDLPFVSDYTFWFAIVGYALLAAGNAVKGF
jgi:cytochrome c oxidase subunit IV